MHSLRMQAPVAVALFDGPTHVYSLANARYREMMNRDDLEGKAVRAAFPEVAHNPLFSILDEVYRTGSPFVAYELPTRVDRCGDGAMEQAFFKLNVEPIHDDAGQVMGVMAVAVEITDQVLARRRAEIAQRALCDTEERLRLALDVADVGTWDYNPVTGELSWDARCKAVFGLVPEARIDYRAFLRRVHPEDRQETERAVSRALDPANAGDYAVEYRTVREGGAIRWVAANGRAFFDKAGRAVRFLGTARDITQHKHLEAEGALLLAKAEAARLEAEAANRAKDEFLAMLGHELRNPLAPIVTALELMKLRGDRDSTREQEVIERQVHHFERLVDDLLDVARITRGKVELRRQTLEIGKVIAEAVEMASPLLDHRRHNLTLEVPSLGLQVLGDEVRLAQVVANLLTNAARYTEPGGDIGVSAARDGADVVIVVRDNGLGISSEILPTIFDAFTQGARSLDRGEGGLGIGLTLVRSLVALHGGTVSAHSGGIGRGSVFTVRLPALPPADTTETKEAAPRAPALFDGSKTRVLIVDDNVDASDLLGDWLRAVGHEVMIAHDGPQALAVAAAFRPEVALLDIGLPVMDGYELGDKLRSQAAPNILRLMAVTGYGQVGDRARSASAGFEQHFVKPIDPRALSRALAIIGMPSRMP